MEQEHLGCEDRNCQSLVKKISRALWGPDGNTGLVSCVRQKVSKKAVWTIASVITVPLVISGVAYTDLKYANKATTESRMVHLEDETEDCQNAQNEFKLWIKEHEARTSARNEQQMRMIIDALNEINKKVEN